MFKKPFKGCLMSMTLIEETMENYELSADELSKMRKNHWRILREYQKNQKLV